jgi:L-lactate utilization protein LutC
MENNWTTIPSQEVLDKVVAALTKNGMEVFVAENGSAAKEKALSLIPEKSEVMTMTSVTLDTIGLTKELDESGKYNSVKSQLMKMDRATQGLEMQRLGAAPEYAIGSVHAITHTGDVIVASNTGSQLPAYAYGATHVVWVVGAQKIVENMEVGMKRLYEYTLPLESERARKAYGVEGSHVSKVFTLHREVKKNRITVILVKEVLGF